MDQVLYKLSQEELLKRKEIVVISDRGQQFRNEIKQQQLLSFHLPKIQSSLESTPNDLSHYSKRAQLSLQGIKSKSLLIEEIKKDLPVEIRPYIDKKLNIMTTKLLKQSDKPINQITNRIADLYTELDRHKKLLKKRRVPFQQNNGLENSLNQTREQISKIEEQEVMDKMASITAMEQRLVRIQQNYQFSLKKRQETMNQVRSNMLTNQIIHEESYASPPEPVIRYQLKQSLHKDRRQVRLEEYQFNKFGKQWQSQPPPLYTSKQLILEQENKQKQQKIQDQLEYELELQKRNQ